MYPQTMMKKNIIRFGHSKHLMILVFSAILTIGCTRTDKSVGNRNVSRPTDSLYTKQTAMTIYGYQPERALQIIDSAVILGNMGQVQAEQCRARIYSMTLMHAQADSLLGGPDGIRLDSAQAIAQRLLSNDSINADLKRLRDVLEVLAYTNRMKKDTLGWLDWSRELVGVCRKMGPDAETDALRTEAEIGAALHAVGQFEQGMAKIDSVIEKLNGETKFRFSDLDALIIVSKRKIAMLGSHERFAETIPLARRIIERLDDYEAHPEAYHDSSHREPCNDQKRADYIRFYRSQAQNYITAAYASLGEENNMINAFTQIENSVREATAREHIARYNELQQQMKAERQQTIANRACLIAVGIGILALLSFAFAVVVIFKNSAINRKNRVLAQQIAEGVKYKKMYWEEKRMQAPSAAPDPDTVTDEQLFQYINEVIVRERLFLDPKFERQTIMDRFQLKKERVGAVFSKGSNYSKMTSYIQQLRLEYAAKLLVEQLDKSIVQIATDSGFSSSAYFCNCFRQHFGLSPTDFRKDVLTQKRDNITR